MIKLTVAALVVMSMFLGCGSESGPGGTLCEGRITGYQSHTAPPDLGRCERIAISLAKKYPYCKYGSKSGERQGEYCNIKEQTCVNCTDFAILLENDCSAFIDDSLSDIVSFTDDKTNHAVYRILDQGTFWVYDRRKIKQAEYLEKTGYRIRHIYTMDD